MISFADKCTCQRWGSCGAGYQKSGRAARQLEPICRALSDPVVLFPDADALSRPHRLNDDAPHAALEEAQSLPIVNLKIGLLPFYWIAPLIYLVLHFYVLVMLLLLARTADSFEQTLLNELPIASEREQFRMRFENALFLQLLVGAKAEREGENSLPLIVIALTTLAIAPVARYCDPDAISALSSSGHHLLAPCGGADRLCFDLAFVRGYRRHGVICWPRFPRLHGGSAGRLAEARRACRAGIAITLWASLWEGRWAGEPLIDPEAGWQPRVLVSIGWVSDRLSLPNETIVGEALLLEKQKEAQSEEGSGRCRHATSATGILPMLIFRAPICGG